MALRLWIVLLEMRLVFAKGKVIYAEKKQTNLKKGDKKEEDISIFSKLFI